MLAETFAKSQEATHQTVTLLAKASETQAEALRQHLDLFKVIDAPTARTLRDQDEFNAELSRFPMDGDAKGQLSWVLMNSADPEY